MSLFILALGLLAVAWFAFYKTNDLIVPILFLCALMAVWVWNDGRSAPIHASVPHDRYVIGSMGDFVWSVRRDGSDPLQYIDAKTAEAYRKALTMNPDATLFEFPELGTKEGIESDDNGDGSPDLIPPKEPGK